ncbi:hypothetical protein FOA52_013874 [Chlamydomonas sp. UWO 241]|nr:hypothetical protein FOA52_013874 [Chlamydomonas sp. UWO 241]
MEASAPAAPPSWRPSAKTWDVNVYFSQRVVETGHTLTEAAAEACDVNPDLSPGLDCCSVCAAVLLRAAPGSKQQKAATSQQPLLPCSSCQKVVYCCEEHLTADASAHKRVCALLSLVRRADAVEVNGAALSACLAQFPGGASLARRPLRSWCSVVPEAHYGAGVWRKLPPAGGGGGDGKGDGRDDGRGGGGGGGGGGRVVAGSPPLEGQQPSGGAAAAARGVGADAGAAGALPARAVELAVASSLMSYPLTLLHALGAGRGEGGRAEPSGRNHVAGGAAQQQQTTVSTGPAAASAAALPASLGAARHALAGCAADAVANTAAQPSGVATAGAQQQQQQQQQQQRRQPGSAPAAAGGGGARPLVACVLGASGSAELSYPQVWACMRGAAGLGGGPVVLQFAGPEVPTALHGTGSELAPGVRAVYWCGEYDALPLVVASGEEAVDVARQVGMPLPGPRLHPDLALTPDVYVGYNMGVTCPDYDWASTLSAMELAAAGRDGGGGAGQHAPIPLVVTSNTHAEAQMEDDVFSGGCGWRARLAVTPNPFVSLELMQSGTLGNDVYRKNAWLAVYDVQAAAGDDAPPKKTKKRKAVAAAGDKGAAPGKAAGAKKQKQGQKPKKGLQKKESARYGRDC